MKNILRRIKFLSLILVSVATGQESRQVMSESPTLELELLGVALKRENMHIWGSSPVMGPDGKIHIFAAQWERPEKGGFGGRVADGSTTNWTRTSEIGHYVGDSPTGPFEFVRMAVPDQDGEFNAPHNPTIKYIDGKYVLLFIVNSGNIDSQRIIMYVADDLDGNWRPAKGAEPDGTILRKSTDPKFWDHNAVYGNSNPCLIKHDGMYKLYFKAVIPVSDGAEVHKDGLTWTYGVALSDTLEGPYEKMLERVTKTCPLEDAYVFEYDDRIWMLSRDINRVRGSGGLLWVSEDGMDFDCDKTYLGFHNLDHYIGKDAASKLQSYRGHGHMERPQVLFMDGEPAYLYMATGLGFPAPYGTGSYVFKMKLGASDDAEFEATWKVDSSAEWQAIQLDAEGFEIKDGQVAPTAQTAYFTSQVRSFPKRQSLKSIRFEQSTDWLNWTPIPNTLPPVGADAPVFLALGPNDYWVFRRSRMDKVKEEVMSEAPNAKLEGFDIPLWKTKHANVFIAEGGLKDDAGGYHAWQSRDMVNWVHHGSVTNRRAKWTTTAEYKDGQLYIYYDFPNDQDPHVYVDDNLFDGKPGKDMGMAFKDPSHGSDCAIIRSLDGKWHLIYEDWSPINAQQNAWDSPLAGHAVSETGVFDFKILDPAVDERTTPTGEIKTYQHPHWSSEDPKNYPSGFVAEYEVHEPAQRAFGDWAAISIGGQYYLFADYDPVHVEGEPKPKMSIAWFTSSSIYEQFEFCGNIGQGHPDPDIGFAEGQFYLLTQTKSDFVSPGPWVEKVEARAGVDTDKDGRIDQWTNWQEVKESYDYIPGFAKQIKRIPAELDTSHLPDGYGFAFEFRVSDSTENVSKPVIEKVTLNFR